MRSAEFISIFIVIDVLSKGFTQCNKGLRNYKKYQFEDTA